MNYYTNVLLETRVFLAFVFHIYIYFIQKQVNDLEAKTGEQEFKTSPVVLLRKCNKHSHLNNWHRSSIENQIPGHANYPVICHWLVAEEGKKMQSVNEKLEKLSSSVLAKCSPWRWSCIDIICLLSDDILNLFQDPSLCWVGWGPCPFSMLQHCVP